MTNPIYVVTGADDWAPTIQHGGPGASSVFYTCPTCNRLTKINIALEESGPTETQLWCHQDTIGAWVAITAQ